MSGENSNNTDTGGGWIIVPQCHCRCSVQIPPYRWPWILPDGRHFIFYMSSTTPTATNSDQDPIAGLYFFDRKTGKQIRVLNAESGTQYANGHLFYLRQQNLIAQRFDPSSGAFSGLPVPIAEAEQI